MWHTYKHWTHTMPVNNKTRWNIMKGPNESYRQFVLWASLFKLTNVTLFSRKRKLQRFIFRITLIQTRSWECDGGDLEKSQSSSQVIQTLDFLCKPSQDRGMARAAWLAGNKLASVWGTFSTWRTMRLQASAQVLSASGRLRNHLHPLAAMAAIISGQVMSSLSTASAGFYYPLVLHLSATKEKILVDLFPFLPFFKFEAPAL